MTMLTLNLIDNMLKKHSSTLLHVSIFKILATPNLVRITLKTDGSHYNSNTLTTVTFNLVGITRKKQKSTV